MSAGLEPRGGAALSSVVGVPLLDQAVRRLGSMDDPIVGRSSQSSCSRSRSGARAADEGSTSR